MQSLNQMRLDDKNRVNPFTEIPDYTELPDK